MDNQQDETQVLETESTETATDQTKETDATADTQVDLEALKAKAAKADELEEKNKQLFERAKKAEAKKEEKVAPSSELSSKDVFTLVKAGVETDDVDEVVRAAKLLGKSIPDALKDPVVQSILNTRTEERRTAVATNTKGGARGTSKVSGEDLLAKAERTGELPDTDEGMIALAAARQARNTRKKH